MGSELCLAGYDVVCKMIYLSLIKVGIMEHNRSNAKRKVDPLSYISPNQGYCCLLNKEHP